MRVEPCLCHRLIFYAGEEVVELQISKSQALIFHKSCLFCMDQNELSSVGVLVASVCDIMRFCRNQKSYCHIALYPTHWYVFSLCYYLLSLYV